MHEPPETIIFRPHWLGRLWYLALGGACIFLVVSAPFGAYLIAAALFQKLTVKHDRLVQRPLWGTLRFSQVRRWGTRRIERRRPDNKGPRTYVSLLVVQMESGSQTRFNLDNYTNGGQIPELLRQRLGPSRNDELKTTWFRGPRF